MRSPKIIICHSFKYKDFLFKNFTKSSIRPNTVYKAMMEDNDLYLVIDVEGFEQFIYIEKLDSDIKDPRFIGKFSEFSVDYLVNNGLPDLQDVDFGEWMSRDHNLELEEEVEYSEDEVEEFLHEDEELIVNSFSHIKSYAPNLSTGILEALSGVISLEIGEIIDQEKEKLLGALKGVIDEFHKSSDIKKLYVAQYLLFNIMNLAKNNWK